MSTRSFIANLRWRGEEGATVLQAVLPLMQMLLQQPKHSGYEPLLPWSG